MPRHRGRTNPAFAIFPEAPAGEGPVLEWYHATNVATTLNTLGFGLLLCVGMSIVTGGFHWIDLRWPGMLIVAAMALYFYRHLPKGFSAGAEWFATSDDTYVRLYELKSIKVENHTADLWLELTDEHGGYAFVSLSAIQQHPDLWDLVYNGIAHSALRGRGGVDYLTQVRLELR